MINKVFKDLLGTTMEAHVDEKNILRLGVEGLPLGGIVEVLAFLSSRLSKPIRSMFAKALIVSNISLVVESNNTWGLEVDSSTIGLHRLIRLDRSSS